MKILSDREEVRALRYITEATVLAQSATCLRAKVGSVIVRNGEIVGRGFNGPAGGDEGQRRCKESKDSLHRKVIDKTCCVHAEQNAMIDALGKHPDKIVGARIYFVKLGENGEPKRSGDPYCTVCSKLAVAVGLAEFVMWREEGVCVYDTKEYNLLSFQYKE